MYSKAKYLSVETILKDSSVVVGVMSDWSLGDHAGISSIRLKEAKLPVVPSEVKFRL